MEENLGGCVCLPKESSLTLGSREEAGGADSIPLWFLAAWLLDLWSRKSPRLKAGAKFRRSFVTSPGGSIRLGQTPWLQGGGTFGACLAPGAQVLPWTGPKGGRAAGILALTCCPPPPATASPPPSAEVKASGSGHTESGTRTWAGRKVKIEKEGNLTSTESPEPWSYLSTHPSGQPTNIYGPPAVCQTPD